MAQELFDNFEKTFLGVSCGIGLKKRDVDDLHVIIYFLAEDDGNWFVSENGISSFWIPDFNQIWAEVQVWIQENCDPDVSDGISWGYKFRSIR